MLSYLHFGAPKVWYCVSPNHRERFERMMRSLVPELFMECNQCLRHKEMMVSPQVLKRFNIPYVKFVQKERDFD